MAENLDPASIAELNERLRELSSTSGTLANRFSYTSDEAKKLGDSFAKLNDTLQKKTREDRVQAEEDKKRLEIEKDLNKILKDNAKNFRDGIRANSDWQTAITRLTDHISDVSGGSRAVGVSMELARIGIIGFVDVLKAAYQAQINYTKSLLAGERGQQLEAKRAEEVGKAFNNLIDTLGNFMIGVGTLMVASLNPIAMALGAASIAAGVGAKSYAAASNAALELATQIAALKDGVFKGFNELSKASMGSAKGMTGLIQQLHSMQMSMAEINEFTGLVKDAGKDIRLFGQRTTDGLESFTKTAGNLIKSDFGRTLEIMGITAQDQREHTLTYLTQQARLGNLQGKSVEQLSKSAGNYILEMDRLAELTGATRKEQEDAQKQLMAIEELRAKILITTNEEEKRKLQFGLETSKALMAAGLKPQGADLAKMVASGGMITTTTGAAMMQSMPSLVRNTLAGKGSVAGNLIGAAPEFEKFLTQMAAAGQFSAKSVESLVGPDGFGKGSDFLTAMKNLPENVRKGTHEEIAKYLAENRKVTDPQMAAQVDLIRTQRESAIKNDLSAGTFAHAVGLFGEAVDRLLGKGSNSSTPTSPAANNVTYGASSMGPDLTGAVDFAQYELEADRARAAELSSQRAKDPLAGLRFKNRAENTGGGQATPALLQLAYKIQEMFPNATFTALNDLHHVKNNPDSAHVKGKALDFSLSPGPKDIQEADAIVSQLRKAGVSGKIRDEYFRDKNAKTTGPHFHVEVAHGGGMFSSSMSEFPVLLKNNEYVLTQDHVNNLRNQMGISKNSIDSVLPEATNSGGNMFSKLIELQSDVSEKLGKMISVLESGESIQNKMLRYARA